MHRQGLVCYVAGVDRIDDRMCPFGAVLLAVVCLKSETCVPALGGEEHVVPQA